MADLLYANDTAGAHAKSYYAATAAGAGPYAPLEGELRADVAIIGGGFTGLSAALHLAERGYSVRLLEAHRVGWGASGRNGGQLGSGQRKDQPTLEAWFGPERAAALWALGEAAKETVRGLIATHEIACDYTPGVLHACSKRRHLRAYQEEVDLLNGPRYGYDQISYLGPEDLPAYLRSPAYLGGTIDWGAGHLHPLNYAQGIARAATKAGAQLHERSEVLEVTTGKELVLRTAGGRVTASYLILGCNGYLRGLAPKVARHVMPINNFIMATEPLGVRAREILPQNVAVADDRFVVNYFRLSADGRLLFGGGESYGYRFPRDIDAVVRRPLARVFPQLRDVSASYLWGGTLAITRSRLPHFARLAPNILSLSGYSGHGVGTASFAGRLGAEAIAGQAERFDVMAALAPQAFPGGARLRSPLLVLAMSWFALRDRLGL